MSGESLPALVLVPLAGAVAASLAPPRLERVRSGVAIAVVAVMTLLTVGLCTHVFAHGAVAVSLGGWPAGLGIRMGADAFGAVMLALTTVVTAAAMLYATATPRVRGAAAFWPLSLGLWAALNAVYLAEDLFNAYVALELMGVCAVALVALGGRDARPAALRYLFVAVLGSLLFLLAVTIVYAETGVLDMTVAADRLEPGPAASLALALTTAGMALKSALFPVHSWLPPAHAGAPAAISPLLSALVVKASLFVLIRVWTMTGAATPSPAIVLGVLGALAVAWGCAGALRQSGLKQVVAFSTVAQVGYLFLALGLTVDAAGGDAGDAASRSAWSGLVVLIVAHGLAKAAMFLAAGAIVQSRGTGDLARLSGTISQHPASVAAFAIAGVSLAGLPPTIGFVGKWEVLQASLGSGRWWWIPVLLAGGLVTFAYVARVIRATFGRPEDEPYETPRPVARRLAGIALTLSLSTIALGFLGVPLIDAVTPSWPFGAAS